MNRLLAVIIFSAVAWAQPQEAKKDQLAPRIVENVRKVVEVKHLSGDRAERAVNLVRRFMHPSQVDYDPVLRTVVMIGPADVVASGEALLRKFDTPGGVRQEAQVQLRLHLIEASPDGPSGAIPAEVAGAVEQMKKTFAYKGYRLLDTLLLQGRGSGEVGHSGTLAAAADIQNRTHYTVSYKQADVLEDSKTVVVRDFRLNLRVPYQTQPGAGIAIQFAETGIKTDFTITEGQKLVIGKVSSSTATNAIFVIVTADVM